MDKEFTPKLLTEFRIDYGKCISKELKAAGLNDFETSYGMIIRALSYYKKMTMKELATDISRDKSTVTVLVRKLEEKGYVTRMDNPADQRSKFIVLTSKAENLYESLNHITTKVNELMWTGIEDAEGEQFMNTLDKILTNVKKHANRK